MIDYPMFAVIGKTNRGKSTFVATMTANEEIEIGNKEGVTQETRCYPLKNEHGKTLYEMCDTPGFEKQAKMLHKLKESMKDVHEDNKSVKLQEFYNQYKNKKDEFDTEVEILKPIFEGASIIYFVKGTTPFDKSITKEIEILRWTGQPMMAVLNIERDDGKELTDAQEKYLDEWEDKLRNRGFTTVRRFDAHTATIMDKIDILDSLKELLTEKKRHDIANIQNKILFEICQNISDTAEYIRDLMQEALGCTKHKILVKGDPIKENLIKLEEDYKGKITEIEKVYFDKVKRKWKHYKLQEKTISIENTALFSDESRAYINVQKTVEKRATTGVGIGVVIGATVDFITLGTTLGSGIVIGLVVGGLLGASEGWMEVSNVRDTDKVKWWNKKFTIGAKNAPYGIDSELYYRALFYAVEVGGRPHGNHSSIAFDYDKIEISEEIKRLHKKFSKSNYSQDDSDLYKKIVEKQLVRELIGDGDAYKCLRDR